VLRADTGLFRIRRECGFGANDKIDSSSLINAQEPGAVAVVTLERTVDRKKTINMPKSFARQAARSRAWLTHQAGNHLS